MEAKQPTNKLNVPEDTSPEWRHAHVVHLIAGEIRGIRALWLRLKIYRDPELRREYQETRHLWTDLKILQSEQPTRRPVWPGLVAPTKRMIHMGGFSMTHRSFVGVYAGVLALCVTIGVVRHWLPVTASTGVQTQAKKVSNYGMPGADRDRDWWYFEGETRGKIALLNAKGQPINDMLLSGKDANAALKVTWTRKGEGVRLSTTIQGMGRHPLLDGQGKMLGYCVLTPLVQRDEEKIRHDQETIKEDYIYFYEHPECIDASRHGFGYGSPMSLPGLVGGQFFESVDVGGKGWWIGYPAAFKVYGDVSVKATYKTHERVLYFPVNPSHGLADGSLKKTFPAKTLSLTGKSLPFPSPGEQSALPDDQRGFFDQTKRKDNGEPILYWSLADDSFNTGPNSTSLAVNKTGEWRKVLKSGTETGYGRHEIKDDTGNVVMTVDISPRGK